MTIWMKRILCGLLAMVMGLMGPLSAYAQTVVYFHNDPAGSPIAATDASGNVLWRESYRPYGERMLKPAAANTQWFHGKSLDPDTGMEDFGARNYDPVLGRFLSIDPVDFTEKNIHSFNRYAYGNNNPLRYKDPDGRSPLDIGFLAYDVIKFGAAVYSGVGIGGAAVEVAISLAGVASPIPGTGQVLKGLRGVERVAEAANGAEHAAQAVKGVSGVVKKPPIVIGENMKERVIPTAEEIGGHFYKLRGEWTAAKQERWAKDMKRQEMRGEREPHVDIGRDPERAVPSKAYEIEQRVFGK